MITTTHWRPGTDLLFAFNFLSDPSYARISFRHLGLPGCDARLAPQPKWPNSPAVHHQVTRNWEVVLAQSPARRITKLKL